LVLKSYAPTKEDFIVKDNTDSSDRLFTSYGKKLASLSLIRITHLLVLIYP
jgi:hypothetical protein